MFEADIHTLLPIKNNRIIAASNKASLVVYSVTTVLSDNGSQDVKKLTEYKKLPFHHRESIRCLVSIAGKCLDFSKITYLVEQVLVKTGAELMCETQQLLCLHGFRMSSLIQYRFGVASMRIQGGTRSAP